MSGQKKEAVEVAGFERVKFQDLHYLHPTSTSTSTSTSPPKTSDDGRRVTLINANGSDWWHTPERDSQDGLAWGKWIDLGEEGFEVRVKASIEHKDRVCPLSPLLHFPSLPLPSFLYPRPSLASSSFTCFSPFLHS